MKMKRLGQAIGCFMMNAGIANSNIVNPTQDDGFILTKKQFNALSRVYEGEVTTDITGVHFVDSTFENQLSFMAVEVKLEGKTYILSARFDWNETLESCFVYMHSQRFENEFERSNAVKSAVNWAYAIMVI